MSYPDMLKPVSVEVEPTSTQWRVAGRVATDEIMSAHLSGIEIGMQEHEKIIQNQHLQYKHLATKASEDIYARLKQKFDIRPIGMRIRVQGLSSFGTLFILRADDFYSGRIVEIYTFLHEERKKVSKVGWSFVVMPGAEEMDESAITSDGYTLSYAESP